MRFRKLPDDPHPAKYMSLPHDPPRLFNVEALFSPHDYIAICEGEFDAIAVETMAGIPAVGVPGANAWRDHWARLFKGYNRVFVIGDADAPNAQTGERAGDKLVSAITRTVRAAVPIRLPEGHDANSFINEQGADALREKMGLHDATSG